MQPPHTKLRHETEMYIRGTRNLETSRNLLFVFKQQRHLLHFQDKLKYLFYFPQNAINFIILSFS